MDWRAIVGGNIRKLREARGLTQEKLAVDAEIDLTYLGGIERGLRNPSLMVLVRIAEALQTTPANLVSTAWQATSQPSGVS